MKNLRKIIKKGNVKVINKIEMEKTYEQEYQRMLTIYKKKLELLKRGLISQKEFDEFEEQLLQLEDLSGSY